MNVLVIPGLTFPEPSPEQIERIRCAAGPDAKVTVSDAARAHEHVGDAEAILGFISPRLLGAAPHLKWVHAIASGVDTFLFPAFRQSPVVLTSEKGLVGEHLADHAFGLLLMLTRQLATSLRLGADAWNHRPEMRSRELELTGLTMGCVGFGGTGRAIARRAAAFGMRCQATDAEPVPGTAEVPQPMGTEAFDQLLESSDVIAVCCPLTKATRNLFDANAFERMKPSAYLVNVTRGEVMDETALVHALESGRIRGAALDVAPREPLPPDSRLWSLPNVVMTPHTAGASQFRASRNLDRFVANLERLRAGRPLEGLIDKEKGY